MNTGSSTPIRGGGRREEDYFRRGSFRGRRGKRGCMRHGRGHSTVYTPLTRTDSKVDELGNSSFFDLNCPPAAGYYGGHDQRASAATLNQYGDGYHQPHYSYSRDSSIPPSHAPATPFDQSFSSSSGSNGLYDPNGSCQSGDHQQHSLLAAQTFLQDLLVQQDHTSSSFGSNEYHDLPYPPGYGYQHPHASTPQPFFSGIVVPPGQMTSHFPTFDPNGPQIGYGSSEQSFTHTHEQGQSFPHDPIESTFSSLNRLDESTVPSSRFKRSRHPGEEGINHQEADNEQGTQIIKELELKISQVMHEEDILSKQVENAKEVGKSKSEIQIIYVSFLRKSRERLRLQIEVLHAQDQQQKGLLSLVSQEKEGLEIQNAELNAKVIALADKLTQTQAVLEIVAERNTILADQVDTISQEANEHLTQNQSLLGQISHLQQTNDQYKEGISEKISEIGKLTIELNKIKQSVETLTALAELAKQMRQLLANQEE